MTKTFSTLRAEMDVTRQEIANDRAELTRLRSASAGYRIELDLAARVLADPDYETTATDMEYWGPLHDAIQKMRAENTALREALTLIFDLASQEWKERDGSLKGAVDNQGRRMWFISQDLMETARDALQWEKP